MSHLVFLVHGMGVHDAEDWAVPYIAALEEAYDQYQGLTDTPMTERFQFVPLRYDDIFSAIVNDWADNAEMLGAASAAVGAPVSKLTDWMKGAGELKDNVGWTHAADVLLYRAFSLVRERVCVHVAAQMTQAIAKQIADTGGFSRWSVIAHSLGTAVIHDIRPFCTDPATAVPRPAPPRSPAALPIPARPSQPVDDQAIVTPSDQPG
jgi:hypothetical protein